MSYNITVDTSELDAYMSDLMTKFENMGDGITQFLDNRTTQTLSSQAGSQRRVRTGTYMGTFTARQEDDETGVVETDAYYWRYLEYGTSRGIQPKPIVPEAIAEIRDSLGDFLIKALEL